MTRVLGVDARVGGWVGVELVDGVFARALSVDRLADLTDCGAYAAIGVDVPLGLFETGLRDADAEARKLLGRRASSVFTTPPRRVLLEESYAAAGAVQRRLTGQGLARQSYALRPRILEADAIYGAGSLPLHEVHPELSFTMIGGGHPPGARKKTWRGQWDRVARLASVGIVVPVEIGAAADAAPDDVLDAAAAAWSAQRIADGRGVPVPDPPPRNERGQLSAIWY